MKCVMAKLVYRVAWFRREPGQRASRPIAPLSAVYRIALTIRAMRLLALDHHLGSGQLHYTP